MVRGLLLSGLIMAALGIWGCSEQNNGLAPDTSLTQLENDVADGMMDEPSQELVTAIEQALEEEESDDKTDPAALAQSHFWKNISGPTVITRPGFYRVTGSFSAGGDAIVVKSDWVYLYLGHNTISGPGSKMGRGVVFDDVRFAVVRGGTLENFGVGIVLDESERVCVSGVEINGEDLFADPAHGVAPQIGIMAANSSRNSIFRNEINMVNLGIFIRGDDSFRSRVLYNRVIGGDLGLLGICYNPDGSGDPAGPHDDHVARNYLARFKGGIQASAGAHDNKFFSNEIKFFGMAYEDVDGANAFRNNRSMQIDMPMHTLELNFVDLEDLGPNFAYEGWIIVNGSPITTGVFTVDGSGTPSQTDFDLISFDLAGASKFVLTIEPFPDGDPSPASTHYLGGDFMGGNAGLTVGDPAALGDNFLGAMGPYILNTPSSGSDNTDYANGIWWLDPGAGPGPTLVLPTLPAGWVYEGWVVGTGGPVTTGQFTDVAALDFDGGGPTAGPDPVPPFPGQDYVSPPMSLIGYTAVISIEPYPDNSPAPFTLKPLVDGTIADVGIGVPQSMANNAGSFPTGMASR